MYLFSLFLMRRRPARSTLFPFTTRLRSKGEGVGKMLRVREGEEGEGERGDGWEDERRGQEERGGVFWTPHRWMKMLLLSFNVHCFSRLRYSMIPSTSRQFSSLPVLRCWHFQHSPQVQTHAHTHAHLVTHPSPV